MFFAYVIGHRGNHQIIRITLLSDHMSRWRLGALAGYILRYSLGTMENCRISTLA